MTAPFALATYLPILVALLIILPAAVHCWGGARAREFRAQDKRLSAAGDNRFDLTLFPQYFFFRPDTPHLSEFMAPFVVAIACATWIAFQWRKRDHCCRHLLGLVIIVGVINVAVFPPCFSQGVIRGRSLPARCANTSSSRRMASVSG